MCHKYSCSFMLTYKGMILVRSMQKDSIIKFRKKGALILYWCFGSAASLNLCIGISTGKEKVESVHLYFGLW